MPSKAAFAVALLCCTSFASAATPPTLGEDDYKRLAVLGSPAISPDGKQAAVVVSRVVWDEDRRDSDLIAVDVATREQRTLATGLRGLSSPAYSPDGTRIAFVADEGTGSAAESQIFVEPLEGGAPKAVTHVKDGVDAYSWRPDGGAIVYAANDPEPTRTGADRFRDSFVFTTEPIVAQSAPRPDHLFLLDLGDGTTAQLTSGEQSFCGDSISWSPDQKTIAFTLCRNAILNDENYSRAVVLDVASREVRALTGRSMWEGDPIFSPDGAHIAYQYSNGDPQINLNLLYVTTPRGGVGSPISGAIGRPIGDAVWSRDAKSLIVTAPQGTTNALYRLSLNGAYARIPIGDVVPGIPLSTTGGAESPSLGEALAPDGTLAFVATSTSQPLELYAYSPASGATKLTGFNDAFAQYALATARRVTFATTTGVTADGVLYEPPGFSPQKKYPLVVYIHGGPTDASMTIFDFWSQVMAAHGWLVLRPNYRGSPNLGLKYQRGVLYDLEDGPGKDVMAAVAAVRSRGIVDPSRIAVCGWSYGGIMTAWLISKYHIWSAAVSGASVNDWITDYGTADDSLGDADLFHGSPFTGDAAEWRRASAITYVRDVTTPVLILSDVGDNRDPFATSSMYWRALRDNGKPAVLRVWPVAGHLPGDPVRLVDVYHYWIDFIAAHFK